MPVAIIDIEFARKRIKKAHSTDLYWYDAVDKGMRKFSGSQLIYTWQEFEWKGEKLEVFFPSMGWMSGKTIASTKDFKIVAYQDGNNYEDIVEWYKENKEELQLDALNIEVAAVGVLFPLSRQADVEDSLYERRFRYNIYA